MFTPHLLRLGAGLFFAFSLTHAATARAEQFIGFGQPGLPGKWALESFPVFNRTAEGNVRAGGNTVLAYFSETGFTDTTRDQLQFWVGAIPGYASNKDARDASPWGIASPNLGFSYYYNVVEPTTEYGADDYTTFWTNPTLMVEFPNGNDEVAGYGAFANRYAVSFSLANYLRVGRFAVTFTPAGIHYAARNRNATDVGTADPQRLRGGVSLWLADVAAGYLVTDDLWLGVHHVYHINNTAASDVAESRVGKIGPSMTYTGFAQQGFYLSANLNFDYYRSANLSRSNELTMALVKFF
ncbi:hypothetical protein [Pseudomonas sp. MH9.3]|uniref:hypothetical protein n=1 Tax=Pseudomonas sp. MH9.3 TaxID=3048630 RepID=UPI002AC8A1A4|nr:hypothetical protein [Pseudomonas sp. MH9.3]MEB0106393.1 hypothetical protein [Pseudomonas sp. MH9.3]WPX79694.1 hypothetical protein RHM60_00815 [Pseudomonas sp. MH9.3]WQG58195.1 hypothetical protein RHM66_26315 [Pseudomonas sp. RTB3]